MKVHASLEELIEAHTKWVLKFHNLGFGGYKSDLDKPFLASNSLALGKPRPLTKNKQTENKLFKCRVQEIGRCSCTMHCVLGEDEL